MAGTFGAGWLTRRQSPMRLLRWVYPLLTLAGIACALAASAQWGYTAAALLLMGVSGLAGGTAFALIPFLNKDAAQQARADGAVAQMGNLGATLGPAHFCVCSDSAAHMGTRTSGSGSGCARKHHLALGQAPARTSGLCTELPFRLSA